MTLADIYAPFGFEADKHHPIVPEPSTYGVVLLALIVVFVLYIKYKRKS